MYDVCLYIADVLEAVVQDAIATEEVDHFLQDEIGKWWVTTIGWSENI